VEQFYLQTAKLFLTAMALVILIRILFGNGRIRLNARAALLMGLIAIPVIAYFSAPTLTTALLYVGGSALGIAVVALLVWLVEITFGAGPQTRRTTLTIMFVAVTVGIITLLIDAAILLDLNKLLEGMEGSKAPNYRSLLWWVSLVWWIWHFIAAFIRRLRHIPTALPIFRRGAYGLIVWLALTVGPHISMWIFSR
jgi:hypothetical protein